MADAKRIKQHREELRTMNDADLTTAVANAKKSIYQFNKDRLSKPQENVKLVKNNRKEIARILTIQRERQIAGEK